MDVDHQLRLLQLGLKVRVLALEAGKLVPLGVVGLGSAPGNWLLLAGEGRAAVALRSPLGHMGGVQAVAPQQFATAGVATGLGFVRGQDGKLLNCGQGALPRLRLGGGALLSRNLPIGTHGCAVALVQAAHAAVRVQEAYLASFYGRLVGRRGKKKAIVAVAHKLLVLAYTLVRKGERYCEPGASYLDDRQQDRVLNRLRARIERLGYVVNLEPRAVAAD